MTMVLARDPAVPHRDRLLNVEEIRAHLGHRLGAGVGIHAVRIKYRPSESLRVVYRTGGSAPAFLSVRTFPPNRLVADGSAAGADFLIPELDAAFWEFPRDRRIRHIGHVLAPDAEMKRRLCGWETTHVVAYAPEKCAVLACLDATRRPIAFAKVYSDDTLVSRTTAVQRRIGSSLGDRADVAIAPILAEMPGRRTVFVAPARGRRIADLPGDSLPDALRRLGRAVATIHALPISRGVGVFPRTTFPALHEAALLVGRVRPALKHAALLLADDLINARLQPAEPVLLHGDLHLKNAFIDDRRVSLIDFDQAAYGAAAADVGSLLAALRRGRQHLAQPFLDGYAAVRPLPSPASLAWHTGAALLTERAARAVTRMRIDTLDQLDRVIDDARDLARAAKECR